MTCIGDRRGEVEVEDTGRRERGRRGMGMGII